MGVLSFVILSRLKASIRPLCLLACLALPVAGRAGELVLAWEDGARAAFTLDLGACRSCRASTPSTLAFKIRGQRGGEELHLRFAGHPAVALGRYLAVEPSARQVAIPLSDLGWAGETQLSVEGFSPDQGGSVYVSDLLLLPTPPPATAQASEDVEVFSPDGSIRRLKRPKRYIPPRHSAPVAGQTSAAALPAPPPAPVTSIQVTGAPAQRFNMVFVGDGYQSGQLGTYATHALNAWNGVMAEEPYITYKPYFNAYRVDVTSTDAGVDNDPQGVFRNTPLNMTFWCSGIDRLLCVDTTQVASYAANAPGVDQTVALANSTTYGGAGYGLVMAGGPATAAGGNSASLEILRHELGHSLAKLEDEYVLYSGNYSGAEINPSPSLTRRNISINNSAQIAALPTKWAPWLGLSTPDGGLINAFAGASNGDTGVYRPSSSSKMRVLGVPFNLVGREAIVLWIYTKVRPIDTYSPPQTQTLSETDTAHVVPMQPVGHNLDLTWSVDGAHAAALDGVKDVAVGSLGLAPGAHTLTCVVVDNTVFVKDSAYKAQYLTQELDWNLQINSVATPTRTSSPSATRSTTPSATATRSPSRTATLSPSASRTATPTGSPSATQTLGAPSPTPSATPSAMSSATESSTASATPSGTASPTKSGTPSGTPSVTWSATSSATLSVTPSATLSVTPSTTMSETPSASSSPTPSDTPGLAPSATSSETSGATASTTPSVSPSATPSATLSATPSASPTGTASPMPSITPSGTPGVTLTVSPTVTPTALFAASPTPSPSPGAAAASGQLGVLRAQAVPQPGPKSLRLELAGPCERVEWALYSASMRLVLRGQGPGAAAAGWTELPLPPELGGLAGGVYFFHVHAVQGSVRDRGVLGRLVLVR